MRNVTFALSLSVPLASPLGATHAGMMDAAQERRLRDLVVGEGDFVARALRNLGVSGGELDDCVQKVFLVLSRRLDDVEVGKEKAFLFGCCQNTAAHFRRSLARKREVSDEGLIEMPSREKPPDLLTEQKRHRDLLDRILETMDDSLRGVFVLHAFEELTMAEIAQMLDIPAGTVASRLRRAREVFKKEFESLERGRSQESA